MSAEESIQYIIRGRVQGVGFRYFVLNTARRLNLVGTVRNLPDGAVECRARGNADQHRELEQALRKGPPMSRVEGVSSVNLSGIEPTDSFEITY